MISIKQKMTMNTCGVFTISRVKNEQHQQAQNKLQVETRENINGDSTKKYEWQKNKQYQDQE